MGDRVAAPVVIAGGGLLPGILIVDDDPLIRRQIQSLYPADAYRTECAATVDEALEKLAAGDFSLAVVDLMIPGSDGITLTRQVRERWPGVDIIMVTGHGSIKGAVEAMRHGAYDYITKPFDPDEIIRATQKVFERRQLLNEIEYLRRQLSDRYTFANMVSRDPVMLDLFATVEMLAQRDVTVVITGESGTGKELVARAIHFQGKRKAGHFVAINCAAVPEPLLESELFGYERGAFTGALQERVGKLEYASGGTLFLDEIASIPLPMQTKLLRVLEDRVVERLGGNRRVPVDIRIVAATNKDLSEIVASGAMREDFYYRINVVPITLPPLRERIDDIPLLVAQFLRTNPLALDKGVRHVSDEALTRLLSHPWPGNVRELMNVLERAVLLAKGDTLREPDLRMTSGKPPARAGEVDESGPLREFLLAAEKGYLQRLLTRYHGAMAAAARHASIDQATLHRKVRLHGLDPSSARRGTTRRAPGAHEE